MPNNKKQKKTVYCGEEDLKVRDLKFFNDNPKKFSSKKFGQLKKILSRDGLTQPITVNKKTMTVLDGNQRLKGAIALGWETIRASLIDVAEKDEPKWVAFFNETRMDIDPSSMADLLSKYEIVKDVDESYNYVVFIFKKNVDFLNVQSFFNLARVYDPQKNRLLGMGRVVDGSKLLKLLDIAKKEGAANSDEL